MKALAFGGLLAGFGASVFLAGHLIRHAAARARARRRPPWTLVERPEGELLSLYAHMECEPPKEFLLAAVEVNHEDFASKVEEARSLATQALVALNATPKRRR